MRKIIAFIPFVLLACNNSNEQTELQKLRDSINVANTKSELQELKDSINTVKQTEEDKVQMERNAARISDSIAAAISASMNEAIN
jgi:hypothetical protein